MQTGLQHGMLPLLKPSVSAVSLNPQSSLFLPSCLTSLQSLWQILADRGPAGREVWNKRKVEGGENCTSWKNFPQSLQAQWHSPEDGVLFLGSLEVFGKKVWLLYVPWFRKVGNERYHYPYIHTGAYSDGEGS